MTIEQNKETAAEFFARLSAGNVAGALEILADDATWWIAGKPGSMPVVGTHSKEQIARVFHFIIRQLEGGLRMTVKGMTAESERVAVEVESYGELKNGRVYNQEYHILLEFRDGQIKAAREYLDTQHVFAVWFAE